MDKEYIEDGYIKLSRKIFNSKTFSSLNAIQKLVTIYLILMANHTDNEWWDNHTDKFITIKRGSFITSIQSIKKKIKDKLITTQKIRTCIKILKNMQFLTIKTTSHYTLVTIDKYGFYQNGDSYVNKPFNKALTKRQQSTNKALTTNKNGKNGKNDKKKDTLSSKCDLIINYLNEKTGRNYGLKNKSTINLLRARFNEGRTVKDFVDVIDKKVEDWLTDDKMNTYLRPSTLFNRTKFENYLNEPRKDKFDKYLKKE